jgi:hypothetical protein
VGGPPLVASRTAAALRLLSLAALGGLVLLTGLASLWWPFGWDQGIFAWIGDAIVRGGMPYRDAWDVKGPLTFYPYALAQSLVGREMWGMRLIDLLITALGAGGAARIVGSLAGRLAGAYTAAFIVLQYLGSGYFNTAQPDGWAAFLMTAAVAPLVVRKTGPRLHLAAAASAMAGICLLLKLPFGIFVLLPSAYVLLSPDLTPRSRLRGLALSAGALAAPVLLCAAWFAWRGALGDMLEATLLFNLEQASAPGLPVRVALERFLRRIDTAPGVSLAVAAALVGAATLAPDRRRALAILGLWTILGFALVWMQHRFWSRYHWHVAYVPLAVLAGTGLGRLWHRPPALFPRALWKLGAAAVAILLFRAILPAPVGEVHQWLELARGRVTRADYLADFHNSTLSWSALDSRRLAEFVRQRTGVEERVFVWSNPLVLWLAGRQPPGRLAFHIPVNFAATPVRREAYRRELLRSLEQRPPKYIAIARRNLDPADSVNEANAAARFPAFVEVLRRRYQPVTRFGEMDVYRRAP